MSNALSPITGTPITFTPSLPAQQVTVGNKAIGNPNFIRSITLSNEAVRVSRGSTFAFVPNAAFVAALVAIVPGLTYPPLFSLQPISQTTTATVAASFTIAAAGEFDSVYPITYQWAVATEADPNNFINTSDSGIYSGSTTPTLTVTPPDTTYNGNIYRCVATNAAGSSLSNGAVLTVT